MPCYMLQVAYAPEAWATLTKNPENRVEAIRPVVEGMGGRIHEGYCCFGDYDIVVIFELPDNVSAAAFSIAISSKGAVKAAKTTPLLTTDETVAAMRKAGTLSYEPPA